MRLTSPTPLTLLVEGGGFEPPKAEPADLQSAPFGRSGTPPQYRGAILRKSRLDVNHYSHYNTYQHLLRFWLVAEHQPKGRFDF